MLLVVETQNLIYRFSLNPCNTKQLVKWWVLNNIKKSNMEAPPKHHVSPVPMGVPPAKCMRWPSQKLSTVHNTNVTTVPY